MTVILTHKKGEFHSWENFPGHPQGLSDQDAMSALVCRMLDAIGEEWATNITFRPFDCYFLIPLKHHNKKLHVDHDRDHTITALQLNGEDAKTQELASHLREALVNLSQDDFFIAPEPRVLKPNFQQPDFLKIHLRKTTGGKKQDPSGTNRKETLGYRGEKHFHKWLMDRGLTEHSRWLNEHEESGQPRDFWVQDLQIEVKTTNGCKVWVDLSEHERREAHQHPDSYFVVVVTLACQRVDAYCFTQGGFQRLDEDSFLKRLKAVQAPSVPLQVGLQKMPSPVPTLRSGAIGDHHPTVFPMKALSRRAEQVFVQLTLGRLHLPMQLR